MTKKNSFLTRKEWRHLKWYHFKFFVYTIFHRVSKFQNWEIVGTVRIKAKKKARLITGNTVLEGGQLIIE